MLVLVLWYSNQDGTDQEIGNFLNLDRFRELWFVCWLGDFLDLGYSLLFVFLLNSIKQPFTAIVNNIRDDANFTAIMQEPLDKFNFLL